MYTAARNDKNLGNLGALPSARVTGVQSTSQVATLIRGNPDLMSTLVVQLDNTFLREFKKIGTGSYTLSKESNWRQKAGHYWPPQGKVEKNTNVSVTERVGNFAKIGTNKWIDASALGASVTDAQILASLKSNLAAGVTHALALLAANPTNYITDNGFTAASVTSLVNSAANKAIQLTANSMGY